MGQRALLRQPWGDAMAARGRGRVSHSLTGARGAKGGEARDGGGIGRLYVFGRLYVYVAAGGDGAAAAGGVIGGANGGGGKETSGGGAQ
eukprot:3777497-Prymnesium_polylepis.1